MATTSTATATPAAAPAAGAGAASAPAAAAPASVIIPLPDEAWRSTIAKRLTDHTYHDFPKKGVAFLDVFPLFREPDLVRLIIASMAQWVAGAGGGGAGGRKRAGTIALATVPETAAPARPLVAALAGTCASTTSRWWWAWRRAALSLAR